MAVCCASASSSARVFSVNCRLLGQRGVALLQLQIELLGQPMHAFDRDAVTGPITVRLARPGEKLQTLDGSTRTLTDDDLLITDDSGPIGLAAVMGGATTEIGDGTTSVLLEAAHWEPTGVARTARRHRLPSEAAKRFERGVDPEMTVVALARAARLLAEYGGARVVGGLVDVDTRSPREPIPLDPARPGLTAGVDYDPRQVVELLDAVGCVMTADTEMLSVTPPSWRPDLTDPADLVEEVVRLAGYDEIPLHPADRAAGPRPHRGAAAPPQHRPHARRGRLRRGPGLPVPRHPGAGRPGPAGGRRAPCGGHRAQPALGGGAGAADDAAAGAAGHPGPQPLPGSARRGALRARGGLPRRPALAGAAARRRPAAGRRHASPPSTTRCRRSRGTWPWPWPGSASRAAGGARGARPCGPTRCRPRGWSRPPPASS